MRSGEWGMRSEDRKPTAEGRKGRYRSRFQESENNCSLFITFCSSSINHHSVSCSMAYRNLNQCIDDLAATKRLVRVDFEVDANLEAAEIHRRINQAGGPAVLFTHVKNC